MGKRPRKRKKNGTHSSRSLAMLAFFFLSFLVSLLGDRTEVGGGGLGEDRHRLDGEIPREYK